MFDRVIYSSDLAVAVLKGMIMAATVTLLNVEFWRAVVITIVSACLTGLFGLFIAWVTVRETRATRRRIEDVAGKVEADRRAGNHADAGSPAAGTSAGAGPAGGS